MRLGTVYCPFSNHFQTFMLEILRRVDVFLSAVFWIAKEGTSWRALPKVYGYWNTIYRRFGRWCDAGVFEALHEHFHDAGELSALLVDSTIIRVHSCAAGARKKGGQDEAALGRSRGGFTSKLHLSLSDDWIPLHWLLTSGNRNDITQAPALIQGYSYEAVIADKAYDSDAFREQIVSGGGVAVIPPATVAAIRCLMTKQSINAVTS